MANKVSFQLTGDEKDLAQALQKMQRELLKLEERNRKLVQESRAAAKQAKESNAEQTDGLSRVVAATGLAALGWTAVNTAIATGRKLISDYKAEVEGLTRSSRDASKAALAAITGAGDLRQSGRVLEFVSSRVGASSRAERVGAFQGVSGASPSLALDRRLELARQVSRAAPLMSTDRLGGITGELAEAMPAGTSAADVTDMALSMAQRAGANADQLASPNFQRASALLRQSGISTERSFAIAMQAMDDNLSMKTIEQFALGGGKGGNEALQKRLKLVDFAKADTLTEQLRRDVSGDFVGNQLSALSRTSAGGAELAERGAAGATEFASLQAEYRARGITRAREFLTQQERAAGMSALSVPRLVGRAAFESTAIAEAARGSQQPGLSALQGMGLTRGPAGQEFMRGEMQMYRDFREEMAALRKATQEQTEAIKQQPTRPDMNRALRQNATSDLERHSEGR